MQRIILLQTRRQQLGWMVNAITHHLAPTVPRCAIHTTQPTPTSSPSELGAAPSSSPSLSFTSLPLSFDETVAIKQRRFGSQLEAFKKEYEAPIIEAFTTIYKTRRTLGNKRTKQFISKKPKNKRLSVHKKIEIIQEEVTKIEKKLESFAEEPPFRENFVFVDTPEKQARRAFFFGTILNDFTPAIGSQQKYLPKDSEYLEEYYDHEKSISDMELADRVIKELKKECINIPPAGFEALQRINLQQQPHTQYNTLQEKAFKFTELVKSNQSILLGRPAVALAPSQKPSPFEKSPPISKTCDSRPIAFETNYFPACHKFINPYHSRKVILYVKLNALNLPEPVKERFLLLATDKQLYHPEKDLIILKSQKKRTQSKNRRYVLSLLHDLLAEAWKADLNYLPPPDKLLPHIQIERELAEQSLLERKLDSWEVIKQKAGAATAPGAGAGAGADTDVGAGEGISDHQIGGGGWILFRFDCNSFTIPQPEHLIKMQQEAKQHFEKTLNILKS